MPSQLLPGICFPSYADLIRVTVFIISLIAFAVGDVIHPARSRTLHQSMTTSATIMTVSITDHDENSLSSRLSDLGKRYIKTIKIKTEKIIPTIASAIPIFAISGIRHCAVVPNFSHSLSMTAFISSLIPAIPTLPLHNHRQP